MSRARGGRRQARYSRGWQPPQPVRPKRQALPAPATAPAPGELARCCFWLLLVLPGLLAFLAGQWFGSLPALPATPLPDTWRVALGLLLPACYLAALLAFGWRCDLLAEMPVASIAGVLLVLWSCWAAAPTLLTRLGTTLVLESRERATLVRQQTALGWRRVPGTRSSPGFEVSSTRQTLSYLERDDPGQSVEVPLAAADLGRLACFSEHRGLFGVRWLSEVRACSEGAAPDNLASFPLRYAGLTSEAFATRDAPALATPREPLSNADNRVRQAAELGIELAPAVLGLTLHEVAGQDGRRLYLANRLLLLMEPGQPLRVAALPGKQGELARHGRWAFGADGTRLYRCIPAGWCEIWAL